MKREELEIEGYEAFEIIQIVAAHTLTLFLLVQCRMWFSVIVTLKKVTAAWFAWKSAKLS